MEKQNVARWRTAEEVWFEWSHNRIWSTDWEVKTSSNFFSVSLWFYLVESIVFSLSKNLIYWGFIVTIASIVLANISWLKMCMASGKKWSQIFLSRISSDTWVMFWMMADNTIEEPRVSKWSTLLRGKACVAVFVIAWMCIVVLSVLLASMKLSAKPCNSKETDDCSQSTISLVGKICGGVFILSLIHIWRCRRRG